MCGKREGIASAENKRWRDRRVSYCIETTEILRDNLMFCVQLVDVYTKCSSHSQGKSEARCDNAGAL